MGSGRWGRRAGIAPADERLTGLTATIAGMNGVAPGTGLRGKRAARPPGEGPGMDRPTGSAIDAEHSAAADDAELFTYHDPDGTVAGVRRGNQFRLSSSESWVTLSQAELARLPLYRSELVKALPSEWPVWFVETESYVNALARHGEAAVCAAGAPHQWDFGSALDCLRGRVVVLVATGDAAGDRFMRGVAEALADVAAEAHWIDERGLRAEGGVAGALATGTTREELLRRAVAPERGPETAGPRANEPGTARPTQFTAEELQTMDIPEARWAVPRLLPEGATLLAGKPKLGKSWLALGLAVAVAQGSPFLGREVGSPRDVLYLALEDSPRRLKTRMRKLMGGTPWPARLRFHTEWERADAGGIERIREWIEAAAAPAVVIVDTLERIRAARDGRSAYADDYAAMEGLSALGLESGVAIQAVHHTRKAESDDPLEMVSGTFGLTGAADGVMVLRRRRGQADATLFVGGRDVEETELRLRFDSEAGRWEVAGDSEEPVLTEQRSAVIRAIIAEGGRAGLERIASRTGQSDDAVRTMTTQMVRCELLVRDGRGVYRLGPKAMPGVATDMGSDPGGNDKATLRPDAGLTS